MKKAMVFIVANLIVISFMGQSNFNSKNYKSGKRGHPGFLTKKLFPGENPENIKQPFKPKTKSSNFSFATKQKLDSLVYQENGEDINAYKYEYTYNSLGKTTSNTAYHAFDDKAGWIPSYKHEYSYDMDNMLVEEVDYDFDELTNQWLHTWKYTYENDENGNRTMDISFDWDEDLDQWEFINKREYAYNSNLNLELSSYYTWNFEVGQWYYASKQEYTYDDNAYLVSRLYSVWDNQGSQWKGNDKSEYTNDDEGKLLNELRYSWNAQSGEWELVRKDVCEYNDNGRLTVKSFFHWDEMSNDWAGNYRDRYVYDADGNVAEFYDDDWNEDTGEWEFDYMSSLTFDNSYAFNDLVLPFELDEESQEEGVNLFSHMITEAVSSEYNGNSWDIDETVNLYYSSIELGIGENQMISATVYPNPASDYVSFRLEEGPQKMQVEILDMFGKVVLSQLISNGGKVSVGSLKPSIYFYRLIDGNRVFSSGKLSVQ
jgi:hypothetical protein